MTETHDVAWTPEKIEATWDFFSEHRAGNTWYFSAHAGRWIVKRADREIGLKGKRILDYGCGRGDLLAHLFARGIAAEGFEISEESANVVSSRFADEPLFKGVMVESAELPSESFDVAFVVEVVEHLLEDQLAPVLAEVHRVLAPGGSVFVTSPNAEDLSSANVLCPDCGAVFHQYQHLRSLDARSISALFEAHGFRTKNASGAYWGLTPLAAARTWLRNPGRLPQPHLFYVGVR